jgi:hypothetical protein
VRKWLALPAVFLLCFIFMLLTAQNTTYAPTSTEIIRKKNSETSDQIVFEQVVKEIFFGQKDNNGSYSIAKFERGQFPTEARQFALHYDDAYINLNVETSQKLEQVEALFSQIKIEGNVRYSTTIKALQSGSYQLKISFDNVTNGFTINFGNFPPIRLMRMKPLQVFVEDQSAQDGAALLLAEAVETSSLFVTDKRPTVTLRFSERMVPEGRAGSGLPEGIAGNWLDSQTLQLDVTFLDGKTVDLRRFYSVTGNYLPPPYENLLIHRVPEREWVEYGSGKIIGFSPYDSFYDQILFSPNRDRYVGVIDLGPSLGDGAGRSYGFMLEQPGQAPTVIESSFYTSVLQQGAPIRWMDNDQLLYASSSAVIGYNLKNRQKTEYFQDRLNRSEGTVHELAYDPYGNKLYVLLAYHVGGKDMSFYYTDLVKHELAKGVPGQRSYYSLVYLTYKYQLQPLPIHAHKNGLFWTKVRGEGKQVETVYEARDGQQASAPGQTVLLDGNGNAILQLNRDDAGKTTEERYYWWRPGRKPRLIPEKTGVKKTFASSLLAVDGENYYLYDPEQRDWEKIQFAGEGIHLPQQQNTAYYRRDKASATD